ncbi:MAG: hypothetical protein WAT16_13915 [Saprospiraceae bacterium]|nr:hypothetical protein [Saprospiraceae bacterium]
MGLIKRLREKYFGRIKPKVEKKKVNLNLSTDEIAVPRQMRRKALKQLPFSQKQKKQIRVN